VASRTWITVPELRRINYSAYACEFHLYPAWPVFALWFRFHHREQCASGNGDGSERKSRNPEGVRPLRRELNEGSHVRIMPKRKRPSNWESFPQRLTDNCPSWMSHPRIWINSDTRSPCQNPTHRARWCRRLCW